MIEKESVVRCPTCGGTGKAPAKVMWIGVSSTSFSCEHPDCERCKGKKVVKQIVKTEVRFEPV
jgi:DNA-directed RNA polymerase subunit RPC12/RpoP